MTRLWEESTTGKAQVNNRLKRVRRFASMRPDSRSGEDRNRTESRAHEKRLAAIGTGLTVLAHETRNALQRGQANLEFLALELEGNPELLKITSQTQAALTEIKQMFDEVRNFAGPLHLHLECIKLNDIWSQVWTELEVAHPEKPIQFLERIDCHDTFCDVDELRMRQVFRNIFENSIAACNNPGQIEIACSETMITGRPALKICVRDNGQGIHPECLKHIFEPFFTTKQSGTGLGMAISRKIIDAHGGTIVMRNHVQQGAEIVICLPKNL